MGHMAITTLVGLKSEFERFWSQVLAKAKELGIEEPKLPRKKLKPSRFFEKKEGSDFPETAKQHYEKMFSAKDVFKTCMGKQDTWSRGLCHTFCKDMVVQEQIFFISTQKDVRGYQKSCPW